ncbi:T9SS type A sorting domain-containing protein [Flavobacterium sp.]
MKKILLLACVLSISFVNAQVLQSDDFNTLTVGNVGTDITGATAGQGGWLTASSNGAAPTTSTNANNSNFQIIAEGNNTSNGLKIASANGDKGSRFMWKDGLSAAWATRDVGNDVIQVEYDLYTGTTTGTAQVGVRLYGNDDSVTPAASRVLNGFVYSSNTGVLQGVAYLQNGATAGTYLITLGAAPLVLDADIWYRIGFAYDTNTGETIWKVDGTTVYTGLPAANWAGPFIVDEVDVVSAIPVASATIPANTGSSDLIIDNLVVRTDFEENLLNITQVVTGASFSVYPNPAKDVLNISNTMNVVVNNVTLTDLNGRVVKSQKVNAIDAQISISDLATGVYMMNVNTDQGSVTKKIIKN